MRCALGLCSKAINMNKIIVITALILVLFVSEAISGQNEPTHSGTKAASKIGVGFSKAAIKALLTLQGNSKKELLDAAMIEISVAASNRKELLIVDHIELFGQIYARHEVVRQSEIAADIAESRAYNPADPGTYEAHDEVHDKDQACIVAWLPRLRALSAEIPKQCP
jgi:hypothetical protein